MKTDDLIQKLSTDLTPIKPMASPFRLTIVFALMGLSLIGLSFFMMSSRIDLKEQLSRPTFFFELILSFLLALSALTLSTFLSRPGHQAIVGKLQKVTIGFLIVALIYDGFRVAQLSQSQIHIGLNFSGFECFLSVLGYSVMLGAAMLSWLRQGATVNPKLSGLVIGTACVALGNVSITFFCGIDNGMHILLWHFALPLVAALISGVVASRFLLKW